MSANAYSVGPEKVGRASVYLRKNATAEQVAAIEKALKQSDGVSSVKVVSSEDARHELVGLTNDPVLDALPTEAFPASLEVAIESATATERLGKLATQLAALPAVESVETYGAWSDRLASIADRRRERLRSCWRVWCWRQS